MMPCLPFGHLGNLTCTLLPCPVFGECYTELRDRKNKSVNKSKAKRPDASQALFRTHRYTAPPVIGTVVPPSQVPGTVLLMRVRRASESARRTQIQIPIRIVRTSFFKGIAALVSDHDNRTHPLIQVVMAT